VKTRLLEDSMYTFRFACIGDWERVVQGEPWIFRGNLVPIEPYDGFTKPSLVELFSVDIWIWIHDMLVRYAPMVKSLASKVGKFI
jgi:hypothetical protein